MGRDSDTAHSRCPSDVPGAPPTSCHLRPYARYPAGFSCRDTRSQIAAQGQSGVHAMSSVTRRLFIPS